MDGNDSVRARGHRVEVSRADGTLLVGASVEEILGSKCEKVNVEAHVNIRSKSCILSIGMTDKLATKT